MDNFLLIAAIKDKPYLWKIPVYQRDRLIVKNIWKEIAECVGASEKECRSQWHHLRYSYFKKKTFRENQIQLLKKKGISNVNGNKKSEWVYVEHLKFLDVLCDSKVPHHNSETRVKVDKMKLITEVRERPFLWKEGYDKNKQLWNYLWMETAEILGHNEEKLKKCWNNLRALYNTEKERYAQHIEFVVERGTDNDYEEYNIKWKYFEHMKFLDADTNSTDSLPSSTNTEVLKEPTGEIDKHKLIAEIKKRPYLWKQGNLGNKKLFNFFWTEVAEIFGVEVTILKRKWKVLRQQYKHKCVELKKKGNDVENSKDTWEYYDHLKFLSNVIDKKSEYIAPKANSNNQNLDNQFLDISSVCVKEEPTLQCQSQVSFNDSICIKVEPDILTNNDTLQYIEDMSSSDSYESSLDEYNTTFDITTGDKTTIELRNTEGIRIKEEPQMQNFSQESFQTQSFIQPFINDIVIKTEHSSTDNLVSYSSLNNISITDPALENSVIKVDTSPYASSSSHAENQPTNDGFIPKEEDAQINSFSEERFVINFIDNLESTPSATQNVNMSGGFGNAKKRKKDTEAAVINERSAVDFLQYQSSMNTK